MLDTAVYLYDQDLTRFYDSFLASEYSRRFESGESAVIAGMSGHELAYAVISENEELAMKGMDYSIDRSREYWCGWSLAYYQWYSGRSFRYINRLAPIDEVCGMYPVYHEMDIRQFSDYLDEKDIEYKRSAFKRLRAYLGISQRELAQRSGVPLRTIQQYEQGQKQLSHARADVVVSLAKALYCRIEDLI